MKPIIKKRLRLLFFIANIGCIVAVLMGVIAPYTDPVKWWPVALAGLAFPAFLLLLLLFAVCWLFIQPKRSIYSFLTLALAIPAIYVTFGIHLFSSFTEKKDPAALRILSWNVGLMNYTQTDTVVAIRGNIDIFDKLKNTNADVICLQEFFSEIIPGHHYNIMDSFSRKLGYPYYYFSRDVAKVDGNFYSGSIIFSRYRIVDSSKYIFPLEGVYGGSMIRAGIMVGNDTINIYNSRLQLMLFGGEEYRQVYSIKTASGNTIANTKSMIGKLRFGYTFLSQQADFIRSVLDSSRRPYLFSADLNNIPLSYTYGKVKGNLHDAWASAGKGFGRTFQYISPTLRVDHLFFDDHFKITQITRLMEDGETDHHGLLADFTIKAK